MCDDMINKTRIPEEGDREKDVDDLIFPDSHHLPSDR